MARARIAVIVGGCFLLLYSLSGCNGQLDSQPTVRQKSLHLLEVEDAVSSRRRQTGSIGESNGKNYDIRVRLIGGDRDRAEELKHIPIRQKNGRLTELQKLASITHGLGPVTIERQDRRRQVTILANLASTKPLGAATTDVTTIAREVGLPNGAVGVFTGSAEMMAESFASILFCLLLAVFFTCMILAAQFESFIHPFTIMLSLPLSVGGAFGALALTGRTLNIFSMIGMVMLMGLVTKNAILLVDYTNLLRRRGMNRKDALLKAGPTRLRPNLMTAFSTIAGMIPITLGMGDGAETWAPMGTCVVGGMVTSTLLTLIVIPVVYSLIDGAQEWLLGLLCRKSPRIRPSSSANDQGPPLNSENNGIPRLQEQYAVQQF